MLKSVKKFAWFRINAYLCNMNKKRPVIGHNINKTKRQIMELFSFVFYAAAILFGIWLVYAIISFALTLIAGFFQSLFSFLFGSGA